GGATWSGELTPAARNQNCESQFAMKFQRASADYLTPNETRRIRLKSRRTFRGWRLASIAGQDRARRNSPLAAPTIFPRRAALENFRGRRFEMRSASCKN